MLNIDLSHINKAAAEKIGEAFQKSGLCEMPLSYETVREGLILPFIIGGLFDAMGGVERKDGSFVKSSVFDWRMHGDYPHPFAVERNEKVIFIASIHYCWGHLITDAIKRLWFIHTKEYTRLKSEGYRLAYISYPDIRGKDYAYIHRIFQLCGAEISDMIYVNQPSRFAEVVVPDCAYLQYPDYDCCTKEFVSLIDRIKANIKTSNGLLHAEKVYLTRTKLGRKKDWGEKDVEQLFRDNGYNIISPETLSVDDQIKLMMHAKAVVTTEGSIAHTLMFANRDCRCAVLRKANYINKYQILIAKVFLGHFTYVDANHSIYATKKRKEDGPFFLYPTPQLLDFLGVRCRNRHHLMSPAFWGYTIHNNPMILHLRNLWIFATSPMSTKRLIIKNKLHFLKYR